MVKCVLPHPEVDLNVDGHTKKVIKYITKTLTVIEEAKFSRNLGAITANSC